MNISLPEAIHTYFEVTNGRDTARLTSCFTHDAVVFDEGRSHHGHAAIESWLQEVQRQFAYSVEPSNVRQDGDRVTVTTDIAGNFPGSPVRNQHVFLLEDGRIRSLEIR